jgi:hypothetical protein
MMELALHKCAYCGKQKIFWLIHRWEESFYCTCSNRKLHNYHDASFGDYFAGLVQYPITVNGLVKLAYEQYMRVNKVILKKKLTAFDLNHLTENKFYQVIEAVFSCDDIYRLRPVLCEIKSINAFISLISNVNPRIKIPELTGYLSGKDMPFSMHDILVLEDEIETHFYDPYQEIVSDWDEFPAVANCFFHK